MEVERSEDAADIDDSALGSFFDEREKRLGGFDQAKEIGIECVSIGLGCGFLDWGFGDIEIDSGVVDEDVEVTKFGFDGLDGVGD